MKVSQTEKEALALVWACERFNLYLYGLQTFDLVTDHEALKVIYSRGSKPSARIERWVLRLQPYNYKVCYVASRDNIADALSRLTTIPALSLIPLHYPCIIPDTGSAPVSQRSGFESRQA